jgi:ParB family chromosome partitioning protein
VAPPPPPQDTAAPLNAVIQVKTDRIARSPWQPRVSFDEEALRELSESIKVHGVIQPLVCRRLPAEKGGGYELIAGERRLRAAIDAGLTEVPVVLSNSDDKASAEMTIIENIQRQDLNVIEEAVGYKTLADEFGLTQQDVADRVGKARPSVANSLRLLELPDEVKMLLSSGLLSTGHAKVLLSLTDETEQTLLGRRCVEEQLTVRALERLIARRAVERNSADNKKQDIPESHVRYLLEKLHGKFGAPVRLQPSVTFANGRRAKGSIEIDFADNDDLTRLLEIFGIDVD